LRKEHRLRVFEKGAEEDNGTYDGGDQKGFEEVAL